MFRIQGPLTLFLGLLVGSIAFAFSAAASDGVYEINQTCALQTGCFPGDSAGFPVTIASSGAYRLTSNLRSSAPLGSTVHIAVRDVDLDLNEFVIRCSVLNFPSFNPCSDSPHTGAGGIDAAAGTTGVRVRNGVVRDMGSHGILLRGSGEVEGIRAVGNAANGILLGRGSVKDCTATGNGVNGIETTRGRISGNTASENGAAGISVALGLVTDNIASDNGTHGILGASLARSNVVLGNAQCGLQIGGTSGFHQNVMGGNGTNVCGGVNLGANICDGGTCP